MKVLLKFILRNRYVTIIITGLVLVLFKFGSQVSIKAQLEVVSALRDVSSIIFGVVGAWMALLYPDKLASALKKDEGSGLENFDKLISPLLTATIVIAVCLVFSVFRPIITSTFKGKMIIEIGRSVSYSTMICLTATLLFNLLYSLIPIDIVRRRLDKLRADEKMHNLYSGGNIQRKNG